MCTAIRCSRHGSILLNNDHTLAIIADYGIGVGSGDCPAEVERVPVDNVGP